MQRSTVFGHDVRKATISFAIAQGERESSIPWLRGKAPLPEVSFGMSNSGTWPIRRAVHCQVHVAPVVD